MPDDVTGADFKAWREPRMSQAKAGAALGVSRVTVNRWEAATDKPVPATAAALVRGEIAGAADAEPPTRARKEKPAKAVKPQASDAAPDDRTASPAIREALKRSPLFAKTTAEAFAMRDELARRGKCDRSTVPLIPLRPDWVTCGKYPAPVVKVNAAIPRPLSVRRRGEGWVVVSENGRLYDYETADPCGRAA